MRKPSRKKMAMALELAVCQLNTAYKISMDLKLEEDARVLGVYIDDLRRMKRSLFKVATTTACQAFC
jgi:hypothetical protein